jgi:hypothetical protein
MPTGSVNGCNIIDNSIAFEASSQIDHGNEVIDATNNWWGVTEAFEIEDLIHHNVDDSTDPLVVFEPYAFEEFWFDIPTNADRPEHLDNGILPSLTLLQNYPNPFNASTTIEFRLQRAGNVEISVLNIAGQTVRTLLSDTRPRGLHAVVWDGRDDLGNEVVSGVYFYRIETYGTSATRKMILLK